MASQTPLVKADRHQRLYQGFFWIDALKLLPP